MRKRLVDTGASNGSRLPSVGSWNVSVREVFYVLALAIGWAIGWADLKSSMTSQGAGITAIQQRLDAHERQAITSDEANDRAVDAVAARLAAHEGALGHAAALERTDALRVRVDHLETRVQQLEQIENDRLRKR